jgi:hypothetical protein
MHDIIPARSFSLRAPSAASRGGSARVEHPVEPVPRVSTGCGASFSG